MTEPRDIKKRKIIGQEPQIDDVENDHENDEAFQTELARLLSMLRAEYERAAGIDQAYVKKGRQKYAEKYEKKTPLSNGDITNAQTETRRMYQEEKKSMNVPTTDIEIMRRMFELEGDNYQATLRRTGFQVLATDENFARLKQMYNIPPAEQ